MTIRLLTVGRPRQAESIRLHDLYAERLVRLGFAYKVDSIPDVEGGSRFSEAHAREREARALRERVHGFERRGVIVALDANGTMLDSPALAQRFERWITTDLTFVIGGPAGLDPSFTAEADFVWSLSRLTFPHEGVRVIVVEQLYRAATMLRGLPYHR